MADVDIIWVFRPDDPSKQGKKDHLPADLARIKVAEGLARLAPVKVPDPEPEAAVEQEAPKAKRVPAQAKASAES